MDKSIHDMIISAKVHLLFTHPFFGAMLGRLEVKEASSWCSTMATDGRYIYYNTDFVKSLTKQSLVFVLCHEVYHCCFDHLGRRDDRNPLIWNMATDYVVNADLHTERIGDMPKAYVVKGDKKNEQRVGLYDPKYAGWSAEKVYQDLIKNNASVKITLDMHLEMDADGGSGGSGGSTKTDINISGEDGPPKLTREEIEKIRNEIRSAMIGVSQSMSAGKVPSGIQRLVSEITASKMDWRQMINMQIQSLVKNDFTFSRPNRKTFPYGIILPGSDFDDEIEVHIGVDASGSVGEAQLRDFLGEIKGIMDQFSQFKLHVWSFDGIVDPESYHVYTPENADELVVYPWVKGGGGTDFMSNWDFMREHEMVPSQFIMFTDGLPNDGIWGDENYCDTLFVIHNPYNDRIKAPFGNSVYYEARK